MRKVIFSRHAISQMFEREISVSDVETTIAHGDVIEDYPDDKPYPSRLIIYKLVDRPIHVVAAENIHENEIIVVTAYEPSLSIWDSDFRKRRLK
jgi:hypothetical protein